MSKPNSKNIMESKVVDKVNLYVQRYNEMLCKCKNMQEVKDCIESQEKLKLDDIELTKKKRTKNHINPEEQCQALRANKTQCTRRKKLECHYCGTHMKGTPYCVIEKNAMTNCKKSLHVFTQEIQGILYYIDNDGNIYNTEDIVNKLTKPRIIGKYDCTNDICVRI